MLQLLLKWRSGVLLTAVSWPSSLADFRLDTGRDNAVSLLEARRRGVQARSFQPARHAAATELLRNRCGDGQTDRRTDGQTSAAIEDAPERAGPPSKTDLPSRRRSATDVASIVTAEF